MSTPTDTTTGAPEQDPADQQPQGQNRTVVPGTPWIDEDGNVHNHEVHTDCGAGCPRTAVA